MTKSPTVVLLGAGHAHLHVLAHAQKFTAIGAQLLLVAPSQFWYSGVAAQMLSGQSAQHCQPLDVPRLAAASGVATITGSAASIHPLKDQLTLCDGSIVPFDLLSINVGSQVHTDLGLGPSQDVWRIKPIAQLDALRLRLTVDFLARIFPDTVIAGGGASGIELAANLAAWGRALKLPIRLTLLARGPTLLPHAPPAARQAVAEYLQSCGVTLRYHAAVQRKLDDQVITQTGECIRAKVLILATGLMANPIVHTAGVPWHPTGGIHVNAQLQVPDRPTLFAVGDCAHFLPHPLPKVGVFGVTAGPVLVRNLLAAFKGEPLTAFKPQKNYLSILNLGPKLGLALRGDLWWLGQSSLWLKQHLDQRFLHLHRKRYAHSG